jgi:hypothetical protein
MKSDVLSVRSIEQLAHKDRYCITIHQRKPLPISGKSACSMPTFFLRHLSLLNFFIIDFPHIYIYIYFNIVEYIVEYIIESGRRERRERAEAYVGTTLY